MQQSNMNNSSNQIVTAIPWLRNDKEKKDKKY